MQKIVIYTDLDGSLLDHQDYGHAAADALLDELEATGQRENTLILFTSDHGEMLGDHGLMAKMNFYRSSVRVPLIVRAPSVTGSRWERRPVALMSLLPTVLGRAVFQLNALFDTLLAYALTDHVGTGASVTWCCVPATRCSSRRARTSSMLTAITGTSSSSAASRTLNLLGTTAPRFHWSCWAL